LSYKIIQNKIDLVSEKQATENFKQIKEFLKNTSYKNIPIIPLSAQHRIGMEFLIQAIQENIPTPKRDPSKDPQMLIARSFDINRPGINPKKLVGGVLGGSLKQGVLKIGDEIEIKPGRSVKEKNKEVWKPIKAKIVSVNSGSDKLDKVGPGGSIGVMTSLDPSVVKSDQLTGSIVGFHHLFLEHLVLDCLLKLPLLIFLD